MVNKNWGYLGKVRLKISPEDKGTRTIRFLSKPPSREDILDTIYYMRALADKTHIKKFMAEIKDTMPANVYQACEHLVNTKASYVNRERFLSGTINLNARAKRNLD